MSTVRKDPACALYRNSVHVIGGQITQEDTDLASTEIFDLSSETWKAGADLPKAIGMKGKAFVYQDILYLLDVQVRHRR